MRPRATPQSPEPAAPGCFPDVVQNSANCSHRIPDGLRLSSTGEYRGGNNTRVGIARGRNANVLDMARKIVHQLVDDIDGTVLEPGEGETVLFAVDGKSYEIDLTEANAAALRDALAPYIAAGRRAGGSATTSAPRQRRRGGQKDYGPVREWAKANGYTVSERGRVPAAVLEAYEAAN